MNSTFWCVVLDGGKEPGTGCRCPGRSKRRTFVASTPPAAAIMNRVWLANAAVAFRRNNRTRRPQSARLCRSPPFAAPSDTQFIPTVSGATTHVSNRSIYAWRQAGLQVSAVMGTSCKKVVKLNYIFN